MQCKSQRSPIYYHKDGLLDITIGLGILMTGLILRTELVWMIGIFIPVFLPIWQSVRKRLLERPLGEFDINPQQQAPGQKVLLYTSLALGILVLASVILIFTLNLWSGKLYQWLRDYFLLAFGGVFASIWVFAATLLRLHRFYFYAIITFGLLVVSQFTNMPFWVALALLGSVITLVGLVIRTFFLLENPYQEKGGKK